MSDGFTSDMRLLVHTFVIIDKKTSIILASVKVTAFDGTIASNGLAKDIVKIFATARIPSPPKKEVASNPFRLEHQKACKTEEPG